MYYYKVRDFIFLCFVFVMYIIFIIIFYLTFIINLLFINYFKIDEFILFLIKVIYFI